MFLRSLKINIQAVPAFLERVSQIICSFCGCIKPSQLVGRFSGLGLHQVIILWHTLNSPIGYWKFCLLSVEFSVYLWQQIISHPLLSKVSQPVTEVHIWFSLKKKTCAPSPGFNCCAFFSRAVESASRPIHRGWWCSLYWTACAFYA